MFREVTVVVLLCLCVNGQGNPGNNSTIGYDAEELLSKIFSGNVTQPRRLIKYEDQLESNHVSFDDQTVPTGTPVKFKVDYETNKPVDSNKDHGLTNIEFDQFGQDIAESGINPLGNRLQPNNGKKKRRRRKPKQRLPGQQGFINPGHPGLNAPASLPGQGFGPAPLPGQSYGLARPGHNFEFPHRPGQNFEPNRFQPEFHGQFYRPPRRRPQPSLASDALEAVTRALTSIAHNDDYQCVARLLCEAAAGGALGASSLLDSVSGLQPLLNLLSAYNGISSNPLFVFGRAAFLGMSSKGNPGSCRYAYPLCPTDPEQLVHYLNNHNGGFFRFFNAPQTGQQNLEQFYNQLSQNYGLYQPSSGNNQENYGFFNPGLSQSPNQPNLYPNSYGYGQNYGFAYPHNQNYNSGNGIRFKNHIEFNDNDNKVRDSTNGNKIEKRIQNKPVQSYFYDNTVTTSSKWLFPGEDDDIMEESQVGVQYINADEFGLTDNRKDRKLKFPDDDSTYNNNNEQEYNKNPNDLYTNGLVRTPKGISFPENQNSNDYSYNRNEYYNPVYPNGFNNQFNNENRDILDIFKRMNNHNNYKDYQDEPGVTTVYVVRGNGDPSKPEIVKLRPGQSL